MAKHILQTVEPKNLHLNQLNAITILYMKVITMTILMLLSSLATWAQGERICSGFVVDSVSQEVLIGAYVIDPYSGIGTSTNNFGHFSIKVSNSTKTIQISYIGYATKTVEFTDHESIFTFLMVPDNLLEGVEVKSNYNYRRVSPQTSLERLPASTVRSLPSILGESDVTRTIQLLPGVIMGSETTSGYFVRGGGYEQNLILIDGTPIYNAYHMFGMFSVFNSDAINGMNFYKGGIPAQHGGRLSSVLDLSMREGNANKYSGEVMLGTFSSKFLVEGPIIKGSTSFLLTGRRSIMDISPEFITNTVIFLSGMEMASSSDVRLDMYSFYDVNAKVNHRFSDKSRLFLTFYNGRDEYNPDKVLLRDHTFNYGNKTLSVRYNHLFSSKLYGNLIVYRSHFNYSTTKGFVERDETGAIVSGSSLQSSSGIEDYACKVDFDYGLFSHNLKFGAHFVRQDVKPEVHSFNSVPNNPQFSIDTTFHFNALLNQGTLYLSDMFTPIEGITINAGVRFDAYFVEQKTHTALQPRIALSYQLNDKFTAKGSYTRVSQPLHLLSHSSSGAPSDIWVPSTSRIAPSHSDEMVAGFTYSFNDNLLITVEGFAKRMDNLIMYSEGASYAINRTDWQDMVEVGSGKSRGLEVGLRKEQGNTTGWISYTLSKSTRQFDEINLGREFTFTYDRKHTIALALVQKLGKRWSLGANWMFASGHAVTLYNIFYYNSDPLSSALSSGYYLVSGYESLNNARMPTFHRLDLCIDYEKPTKLFNYKFSAGAYNAYARRNPYYINQFPMMGVVKVSLFSVIPYISLSLSF